jgi:hypothetical protein
LPLQAAFPAGRNRDRSSYFKGAKGEDVRYIRTAWGSAFVELAGGKTNLLYGRIHGTPYAQVDGGISGSARAQRRAAHMPVDFASLKSVLGAHQAQTGGRLKAGSLCGTVMTPASFARKDEA